MKRILKNPLFLIGFTFILFELVASIYFDMAIKDNLPESNIILYDEKGLPRYHAPFAPSVRYPFGTDSAGYPLQYKILEGAKYTIIISLIITILRMVTSLIVGLTLRRVLGKLQFFIKGLINSFHFAPLSLIAYFIIAPVALLFSWSFSTETEIMFTIGALTLLAVPALSLLISSETTQILEYEFIQNTKVLGGGYFHILRKHVRPYLSPKLFIQFNQQMIQVLLLFAHLGVLGLYIGGPEFKTKVQQPDYLDRGGTTEVVQTITSLSNEWGGQIALARKDFILYPWELYFPALAFALTIFAFTLMLEGVKRASIPEVKKRKKKLYKDVKVSPIKEAHFSKATKE